MRIVVGVDGSEGSKLALRWAANEASVHGADLEVVHTYKPVWTSYPYSNSMSGAEVERIRTDIEAVSRQSSNDAQRLVDDMVAELDLPNARGLAIESSRPAETLVEHANEADMLVLGSRGFGGFKSLMLGSVSQQAAHHATCPLVIIRPPVSKED